MSLLRNTARPRISMGKNTATKGLCVLLVVSFLFPIPGIAALTTEPPAGGDPAANRARADYYTNFFVGKAQPCGIGTDCYVQQQAALAEAKKEEEKKKQQQMMIAMAAIGAAAALLPMLMKAVEQKGGNGEKGKEGGGKGEEKKQTRRRIPGKTLADASFPQNLFFTILKLAIPEAQADPAEDAAQRAVEMAAYEKAAAGEIVSEEEIQNLRTPVANIVDQINNQRRIYNAAQERIADLDKKIKVLDAQEKMVASFIVKKKTLDSLVQPVDAKMPEVAFGLPEVRKGRYAPSSFISSSPNDDKRNTQIPNATISLIADKSKVASATISKFQSNAASRAEALQMFKGDDMMPRISSDYSNRKVFDVEQKDAVGTFLYQANGKLIDAQNRKRESSTGNKEKTTDSRNGEITTVAKEEFAEINSVNIDNSIDLFKRIHFTYESCLRTGKFLKTNPGE